MKWHQLAENPQSLDSLYESVPKLENVELFSINLNREGSQIQIHFDLPVFPDKPSTRWHKDFNTIQIQLSFSGVKEFKAQGWQRNMKVRIDIEKNNKNLEVVISNPEIKLKYTFQSEFLRIEKISPYQQAVS
jgi:Immunity protein 50